MPQTVLDAIERKRREPNIPKKAAAGAFVYHSLEEYSSLRERVHEVFTRKVVSGIVEGTVCTYKKDRSEVVAVWSPPLNALVLPRCGTCGFMGPTIGFIPDHTYERRETQPDDGTGPDAIKQAYAQCRGCFENGWHRTETDVSGLAFGLDPDNLPEYPPPRIASQQLAPSDETAPSAGSSC